MLVRQQQQLKKQRRQNADEETIAQLNDFVSFTGVNNFYTHETWQRSSMRGVDGFSHYSFNMLNCRQVFCFSEFKIVIVCGRFAIQHVIK